MDRQRREKRERLESALAQGVSQLHLDGRSPGVLVPEALQQHFHVVLNVSYYFDPPDLALSDWGVRQTLSFSGVRHAVGIPWDAVYGVGSLVTRDFWLFADHVPHELSDARLQPASAAAVAPAAPQARNLRALEAPEDAKRPEGLVPPRRGHLRVIK